MSNQQRLLRAILVTSELALLVAEAEGKKNNDGFEDAFKKYLAVVRNELDKVERSFNLEGA